jgi:hypothetical protein
MKTPCRLHLVLVLALLALGSITGCKQESAPPALPQKPGTAAIQSAEHTSFAQVTSKLDPGGNLYVYLSTEQWLAGVASKIASWQGLLGVVPDLKPEDRENLDKAFTIVTNLIQNSGIQDLSGFGMSSIARETNFYHSKLVLYHDPGKGSGFLWKMFGQKAHPLDGLNMLPATTALAAFTDIDALLLWSVLQKEVAQSGLPQAEQMLNSLPQSFEKAAGLKWDTLLASLGGEFGFAVTLDDTKVIPIPGPGGGEPIQVPEPALLLVAKVKDDTVFNRIDRALTQYGGQQVVKTDKPGLKMRTWPLPLPLPIQLRPTVASADGYLFICTSDGIIQEVLAAKSGQKPGLKSTQEFQRLAKDTPAQGNGFTFTSQRFGQTMSKIQQAAIEMSGNASGPQFAVIQSLLGSAKPAVSYAVAVNTDEGWLGVANGNQHAAKLLAVGAAVPAGILAAVAVPNFVKARQTSLQNACINNLRQIDGAKQQWALENKKADTETPSRADLEPYLSKRQFPVCPAGGTYTINRLANPPECSHPGHKLGD